jgi:ABC-type Fe3+-hydroxamate transport system substrate-binding protein
MSENQGSSQGAGNGGTGENEDFELLSAPPTAPDISGQLKTRGGGGLPKVTLALIGVVLAVGGFVGGIAVGKSNADSNKSTNTNTAAGGTRSRGGFTGGQNGGTGGTSGQNGQFARGGTVTGTVTAVDGTKLTITDSTGKQVTVDTNAQTTVTIGKTGALTDLANGAQVTVVGTPDSSGTITARSVLSGISNFGFPGGRGNRTPSPGASSPGGSNG